MLAIVSLEPLFPAPLYAIASSPITNNPVIGLAQIVYAVIGLRLPKKNLLHKLVYTGFLIGLCLLIILEKGRMFPLIVIILLIRCCILFNFWGRLMALAITISFILIGIQIRFGSLFAQLALRQISQPFQVMVSLIACICLVFVLIAIEALFSERRGKEKLAIANQQLRSYASRIEEQATLQERNRIAREIHDSLGHSLTALNLQVEATLRLWQINPSKAEEFLKKAKHLGSQALAEVRLSVATMRVDPLAEQNLSNILTTLLLEFQQNTGIESLKEFNCPEQSISESRIPKQMNRIIYRIVQEALTNIAKHAFVEWNINFSPDNITPRKSPKVQITLISSATELTLIIEDNGKGFVLKQNITGFGLQGMRERVAAIGGKFTIESELGKGCLITIYLPILLSE
jgi:signal transduction histidine kinase